MLHSISRSTHRDPYTEFRKEVLIIFEATQCFKPKLPKPLMSLKSCSHYKDGKQHSYYQNGKQKSTAFRIWYTCGVIGFQQFWLVNMYNFNQPRCILPRTSFTWTNYQHKFLCLSTIPLNYVKSETESWSRSLNFINNLLLVLLLPNKVGN